MAQLPPKIPIANNWPINNNNNNPLFQFQMANLASDDFADFAASRRGSHRRSSSDSVAFLEPLIMINHHHDDDELMMMSCIFSSSAAGDDVAPLNLSSPSTDPSSPSDGAAIHNNNNNNNNNSNIMEIMNDANDKIDGNNNHNNNIINIDDIFININNAPKTEPGSSPPSSAGDPHAPPSPSGGDSVFDPKRVKRILANRQSAQRSRVRKLQYISELERSVTTLQSEVSALSPRVAFLDHQRLILNVDNSALKQRIAALAQDKIFKDAHQEALKNEIERLRQVYHQQNLKKMANHNSRDQNSDNALECTDNDQIPN